jgi:hypothetical protein
MQDQRCAIRPEFAGEIVRDALHHHRRILRLREILADGDELAGVLVEGAHIGEGSADVDAEAQSHGAIFCARCSSVARASTARSGVSTTP